MMTFPKYGHSAKVDAGAPAIQSLRFPKSETLGSGFRVYSVGVVVGKHRNCRVDVYGSAEESFMKIRSLCRLKGPE